jgi:hypothetical protein
MNHREPPQVPQGMRRDGHFLTLLLIAAATGTAPLLAHAGLELYIVQTGSVTPPSGYLPLHGAPPLRFATLIVPATPAAALSASEPSKAAMSATTPAGTASHTSDVMLPHTLAAHPADTTPAASSPDKPAPLSILPDEMRPQVRPEDFLPFFQIPGTHGNPDVTVVVPIQGQPAQPAPQTSSATYLQTDK